ncbi:MAG: hypothetical protein QOJ79_1659 [Actinomycetota bacterium]|jgi:class 3 adenylate cyclase|nr:hypothetical protein [Actinomycetota bacterium]
MSMVFAATHPSRVRALVLADTFARLAAAPDYPQGVSVEQQRAYLATVERDWGTGGVVEHFAPSRQDDTAFRTWLGRYRRMSASPGMGRRMQERFYDTDVREVLPIIAVPTLVLHHVGNAFVPASAGRYVAEAIPGSQFVELDGDEHLFYAGPTDQMLDEVEQFLIGSRQPHRTNRVLATVLFTDIVDSTGTAGRVGDGAWRDLLDSHDTHARRQLARFRGREISSTGDGFLATFDAPAPAIQAAAAIREGARRLGLDTRAGVHAGEVELRATGIGGVAVHLAHRILSAASPGEVLVSSTIRDLVTGSSLRFLNRGHQTLKGFDEPWHLYAVDL